MIFDGYISLQSKYISVLNINIFITVSPTALNDKMKIKNSIDIINYDLYNTDKKKSIGRFLSVHII
jgi:hypothetical protein